MDLPLFDVPQKRSSAGADVILRIEHKAGPFIHHEISIGADRGYRIVVKVSGRVYMEFVDNPDTLRPAPRDVTKVTVEDHLKSREWREVVG
jgi:hypothetical protein